jgi:hypothetical protein
MHFLQPGRLYAPQSHRNSGGLRYGGVCGPAQASYFLDLAIVTARCGSSPATDIRTRSVKVSSELAISDDWQGPFYTTWEKKR